MTVWRLSHRCTGIHDRLATTGCAEGQLRLNERTPDRRSVKDDATQVWNFANAASYKAARPFAGQPTWLTAFDLDKLTAGASNCFERIGSDTIQRVNADASATRR